MANLVLGIIVVVAVVAAYLIWRRRRRRELAELVARADRVDRRLGEAEPRLTEVADRTERLLSRLEGPLRVELQDALATVRTAADEARPAVAALAATIADAPSPGEARSVEHRAARAVSVLDRALSHAVERSRAAADRLDAVAATGSGVAEAIAAAEAAAEAHQAQGWKVDEILADVERLSGELAAVDTEPPLDLDATEPDLDRLLKAADSLLGEANGLPEQHRDLMETADELWRKVDELRTDREWLVNQLEAWALLHHPRSLAAVSEHPPAVTGRLDEADELLAAAAGDGGMLSMDRQEVRGAATDLARAGLLIEQSEELIEEARTLNVDLATSAVAAGRLVGEARSAATALADYVADHPHDLGEEFTGTATSLGERVDEADASLALEPPDSLGAMNLAREVIGTGPSTLKGARKEVERMQALRASAKRALSTARSAVRSLDDYTDGLLADVFGGDRRRNVERLQTELRSAERLNELRVNEPKRAEREARAVATEARQLLQRYKDEDHEAELRRRRDDD